MKTTLTLIKPHLTLQQQTFAEAAAVWLETRKPFIKPVTVKDYNGYLKNLNPHFGAIPLHQITADQIRKYQTHRTGEGASASSVNHESSVIIQILKRAHLWAELQPDYQAVPAPRWTPPKVLTPAQEQRLFELAASNPSWEAALLVITITNNTTASGCEVRGLRLKHIKLDEGIVMIPSDVVKNEFRARLIPLNPAATEAFIRAIARARALGAYAADHYLFPFRVKRNSYDPNRGGSSSFIKKTFRNLRDAAGLPWLTPHCLRHNAITKLLEDPNVSEETVKHIAGHVSQNILKVYSHSRRHVLKNALDSLGKRTSNQTAAVQKQNEQFAKLRSSGCEVRDELREKIQTIAETKTMLDLKSIPTDALEVQYRSMLQELSAHSTQHGCGGAA
jgi:integrase